MGLSNSTPRYTPKGIKSKFSNKTVYMKDYSSIIHNSQNIETTQMSSTDEWINKMWFIHTVGYYSIIDR